MSSTTSAATAASSAVRAAPQGGVLDHVSPVTYTPSNPIILFIIQAGIIIIFCRLLHYPLSLLRQPRVIAEVIGGILLGPSVMMRIPGFQDAVFPTLSIPILSNVANLGLILFLFQVALEVDLRLFLQNWKVALRVGLAGMILPFGLGCAIAWGLYNQFRNDAGIVSISFGVYMLFIGTALSITAFPVLCRILTELNLLGTPVGVTVLAAGVGNDVTGWILLALCVALVNNGSGLTALWVLMCCVGWILLLVFAIRPVFMYMLRRSGSIQNGPTQSMVAVTLLIALTSAWFTGIIGVHPIFGAFLAGLICPHEGGFTIKLTEKIEDLVACIFLPLYFALSGLSTNLGLLNDGITWGYVVGIIAVAFSGKIIGGTLAAKSARLMWRESLTIGVLMSCKGLVELIVLNIGLQAKILSTRTFTMFVVMALVTTVSTTPLTSALYPLWYQKKLEAYKKGEIDWNGNPLHPDQNSPTDSVEKLRSTQISRVLVYLRLESLPSLFTFIKLLGGDSIIAATKVHKSKIVAPPVEESFDDLLSSARKSALQVHGVRLVELTERTSSVMKVSEADEYTYRDPVVNAFRTFAQLNNITVSGGVSVVPESSYAQTLTGKASDMSSDLVFIPWSESGVVSEGGGSLLIDESSSDDRFTNSAQNIFVQEILNSATCNAAVFINNGFGGSPVHLQEARTLKRSLSGFSLFSSREVAVNPIADRSHHIFFPFFGGEDDRVALRFVLQVAKNTSITATILHVKINGSNATPAADVPEITRPEQVHSSPSQAVLTTHTAPLPPATSIAQDTAFLHTLRDSLPADLSNRVVFIEASASGAENQPIAIALEHVRKEVGQSPRNAGDLVVVGRGREAHFTVDEATSSLSLFMSHGPGAELKRTLGPVAAAILTASPAVRASVLVVQALRN